RCAPPAAGHAADGAARGARGRARSPVGARRPRGRRAPSCGSRSSDTQLQHRSARGGPLSAGMARISVIVPAYNVEEYLADCLDSVLDQGVDDLEVVVVDD